MENIDPNQAARVWQRVRGNSAPGGENTLEQLIVQEWEGAAFCFQLARRSSGRESMALQQIGRQKQTNCACLKGIHTLLTGKKVTLSPVKPGENSLRGCYEREVQCLKSYAGRASDPDYGYVFSSMKNKAGEHCRLLLELIGGAGK